MAKQRMTIIDSKVENIMNGFVVVRIKRRRLAAFTIAVTKKHFDKGQSQWMLKIKK